MFSKCIQTDLEDGHWNPIIEVISTAPGSVSVTMIDLDVTGAALLMCPILVPAT